MDYAYRSGHLMLRKVRVAVVTLLWTISLIVFPAPAQAIEPVTVAAVGVAITAAGLVATLLQNESSRVKAAAAVVTSGKHGLDSLQASDSGLFSAGGVGTPAPNNNCSPPDAVDCRLDNITGYARAFAYASEGLLGKTLTGVTASPFAIARTKALHALPDNHHAEGAATADANGTVRVSTKGCDEPCSVAFDSVPVAVDFSILINTNEFVLVQADNLPSTATGSLDWSYSASVGGVERFFTSVTLDNLGQITMGYHPGIAGMPESAFSLIETGGNYELSLLSNTSLDGEDYYMQTFYSDMVTPPGGSDQTVAEYDVSADGAMSAVADDSGDATSVPEPATWALQIMGLGLLGGALRRSRGRSGALAVRS
jgi:hypothetical protein